jgi:hypothetical protein
MSLPPLSGTRIKIERAKRHTGELASEFEAFAASKPFMLRLEEDPERRGYNSRLKIRHQAPAAWGGILGDIVHNLRSAYDLLAADLVRHNGGELTRGTGFPISASLDGFTQNLPKQLRGASDAAIDLVRALRPYKDGSKELWAIHELNRIDKHRLLMPVTFKLEGHGIQYSREDSPALPMMEPSPPKLLFMPPVRELHNDTVLDWIFPLGPEGIVHAVAELSIAFVVDNLLTGEPVVPALRQFIGFTEQTMSLFSAEVFKIGE